MPNSGPEANYRQHTVHFARILRWPLGVHQGHAHDPAAV